MGCELSCSPRYRAGGIPGCSTIGGCQGMEAVGRDWSQGWAKNLRGMQRVCKARGISLPTNKQNPIAKLKPHVKMPELQRATHHLLGYLAKAERR